MKKNVLIASLMLAPTFAFADMPQFFIGAKGGYQWADDDAYNPSNPNDFIWGLNTGLKFTPSWSWDIGYQYHNELESISTSADVKTWLIESAIRYDWYMTDNLSLFGRVGVAYWDVYSARPSSPNVDSTGFSPLGEIGLNYHLTPSTAVSLSYQHINNIGDSKTGEYNSNAVMFGLTYTFGASKKVEPLPVVEPAPVAPKFVTKTFPRTTYYGQYPTNAFNPSEQLKQELQKWPKY